MVFITAKLDGRGRITVPREIRKRFNIKNEEIVYVQDKKNYFVVYPSKFIKIKAIH